MEFTVRQISRLAVLFSFLLVLAACASSSRVVSTLEGPAYKGPAFRNLLVIGIADSYNNRATFERTLAKDITATGASATAMYTLVDKDTPIDRPTVEKLVEEGDFDAILITRALNRDFQSKAKTGSPSAQAVRKGGSAANLFRYDYEELNESATLSMELNIVIGSELFSAESREKVWSIEADISDQASVGVLVIDASNVIASRLRKDGLIPK
jgi:hypothetical protein